jgi:hypothetical protein
MTFCLLAVAVALAGCALFDNPRDRALRHSPVYQQGYQDGCASANNEGSGYRFQGTVRDPSMAKNSAYGAGWNNGFTVCRPGRSTGMGTLNSPVPETSPGFPDTPNRPQ